MLMLAPLAGRINTGSLVEDLSHAPASRPCKESIRPQPQPFHLPEPGQGHHHSNGIDSLSLRPTCRWPKPHRHLFLQRRADRSRVPMAIDSNHTIQLARHLLLILMSSSSSSVCCFAIIHFGFVCVCVGERDCQDLQDREGERETEWARSIPQGPK
jgi:hypothetical protein